MMEFSATIFKNPTDSMETGLFKDFKKEKDTINK